MTALMRCPLCGASEGYSSHQVDGPKLHLFCRGCRQLVTTSWSIIGADEDWNAAGVHAQSLRDEIARVASALAPTGARYLDPPDGGDVPIGEQVRRMAEEIGALLERVAVLEAVGRAGLDALDYALGDSAEVLSERQARWGGYRADSLCSMAATLDANRAAADSLRAALEQKP